MRNRKLKIRNLSFSEISCFSVQKIHQITDHSLVLAFFFGGGGGLGRGRVRDFEGDHVVFTKGD